MTTTWGGVGRETRNAEKSGREQRKEGATRGVQR